MATALVACATTTATARPLPVPPLFKLAASDGYSITVWAIPSRQQQPASMLLWVSRKGSEATYLAPASVTETSMQADLGELGEIAVSFKPSGRAKRERPACGGKGVAFDRGFYEGTIEFRGEEGYTQVSATRAKGDLQFLLDIICPGLDGVTGSGPGLPGAQLITRLRPHAFFEAGKNGPGTRAGFAASIAEKRDGMRISRAVATMGPAKAFTYDPLLKRATVRPPVPFSGEATYRRAAAPAGRWAGTLAVDFPGHSEARLTGRALRTALVRAQWNNLSGSFDD